MFGFDAIGCVSSLKNIIDEHNEFNKLCDSLPKDIAERLREDRRARREDEIAHNKALEVADAGRARNFWGN